MKYLLILLTLLCLSSCDKAGTIHQPTAHLIEINGKVYKLVSIVPSRGDFPIWIMYPRDSTNSMPTMLNNTVRSGKHSRNQGVIIIE